MIALACAISSRLASVSIRKNSTKSNHVKKKKNWETPMPTEKEVFETVAQPAPWQQKKVLGVPLLGAVWQLGIFVAIVAAYRPIFRFVDANLSLSFYDYVVYVPAMVHALSFWIPSALLTYVDVKRPAFLWRFKIQKDRVVSAKAIRWCALVVLFNQVVLALPLQMVLYSTFERFGMNADAELPSLWVSLARMSLFVLANEVMFFYGHWMLHHRALYKSIHRMHHDFRAPFCMACEYAHPIEFVLGNVIPVVAGPLLTGAHVYELWAWLTIALLSTISGHSGYCMPFGIGDSRIHDSHHRVYANAYGSIGLLDWLHGTQPNLKAKPYKVTATFDDAYYRPPN
jgi:fatty acid hydroxylase domain-containing protein 2